MLKIAICDDEDYFCGWIRDMLQEYMKSKGTVYQIDTFLSGREILGLGIELNRYQVIFLDINMEDMDGLAVARRIREQNREVFIVFVTAFADYCMEGYKVDAVRFLLKDSRNMQKQIDECMDAIHDKMAEEILWRDFSFVEGKKKVPLDYLLYIESKKHKLEFHMMEEKMIVRTMYETLNHMEKWMNSRQFLRCHQSYLINMKYIDRIERYKVVLYDGNGIPIPKERYKKVLDTYIAYKGEV